MTQRNSGRRIVWLVRILTATALAIVIGAVGLVTWTMGSIRNERARLLAEEKHLDDAANALRAQSYQCQSEIRNLLDESSFPTSHFSAVSAMAGLVESEIKPGIDSAVRIVLNQLAVAVADLSRLDEAARVWRCHYDPVWADVNKQTSLTRVRNTIASIRGQLDSLEGRIRLQEAIAFRQWHNAAKPDATRLADSLLNEIAQERGCGWGDSREDLAELATLVELLAGETQADNLTNIRDNQLRPVMDRLSRSLASLSRVRPDASSWATRAVDDINAALLGQGFQIEPTGGIQDESSGLFALRRDFLFLERQREQLRNSLSEATKGIDLAAASFTQLARIRTAKTGLQIESNLNSSSKRLRIGAVICVIIFPWLTWLISCGIHGQVGALDLARAEAEEGNRTTRKLMIEREASTFELSRLNQKLQSDIARRERTEKERDFMEIQLRHSQKLESIGRLAAGIAHEINSPTQYVGDNIRFLRGSFDTLKGLVDTYRRFLTVTQSGVISSQLLKEVEQAAESADVEYLTAEIPVAIQQSLDGIERVAKIVRAMKDFSHPGSGQKTPTDLNKAIESTVTVCRAEWKYVAEMVTELDSTLPPVPVLPDEFNQVILNIVVNASHAIADVVGDGSHGKGTITIVTARDGDHVAVRIRDTGTGIPEKARDKIFDPFFTTKGVGKGTGQGLAIAHSVIVDKHGGTLAFETDLGKGTTFIVRLPLALNAESHGYSLSTR